MELRVIERDQLSRVFERRGSGGKAVSPRRFLIFIFFLILIFFVFIEDVRKTSAYSNSARMRASSITSMISRNFNNVFRFVKNLNFNFVFFFQLENNYKQ